MDDYTVIVDDGQYSGAAFYFDCEDEVFSFLQTCFKTADTRDILIKMRPLNYEVKNGD